MHWQKVLSGKVTGAAMEEEEDSAVMSFTF
jgi:hypothetical protein